MPTQNGTESVWSVAEGYQVLEALKGIAEGLTLREVLARLERCTRERTSG